MYVRWKKRALTRTDGCAGRRGTGGYALTAVLVESRRVDGQPRQRFVAHLGTLQVWDNGCGDVAIGSGGRAWRAEVAEFWDGVLRRLDELPARDLRKTVEAAIAAKVPRLSDQPLAP